MAKAAGGEENVVMTAGECVVTILPRYGGKISSIKVKGRELLQQPLGPIAPRTQTTGFDESDASGWDECLPSVAACEVEFAGAKVRVPDHGDLWRVQWELKDEATELRDGKIPVTLVGKCFSLPLELERTIALSETANGWRLSLDYRLTNVGDASAPWAWAAHPLFAVEPGDRIVLPESIRTLRLEGSGGGRLGKSGDTVSWPIAKLAAGGQAALSQSEAALSPSEIDLSIVLPAHSGVGDKLFAEPLGDGMMFSEKVGAADDWCELVRPGAGIRIRVSFNGALSPYLGLWLCYGGWPEREGPKQMCVALEPAKTPVDSLAIEGNWAWEIHPGERYEWPMLVDIEPL